ncbi:hypothetical protein ACLOJK_038852 [Asimina triloba]
MTATSDWGRSAPKIQIDPIHKNLAPIRARQQHLLKQPTTQRQSMPTRQLEAMSRRSWHSVRSAPRFRSGAHFYLTIRRASRRPTEPSASEPSAPSTARTHRLRQLCVLATRSNSHRMQIPTVTAAWPRAEKAVSQHHRQQRFCRPTPTIDRTARQIRHPIAPASAIQPKLGNFRVQHPRSFASPKQPQNQHRSRRWQTQQSRHRIRAILTRVQQASSGQTVPNRKASHSSLASNTKAHGLDRLLENSTRPKPAWISPYKRRGRLGTKEEIHHGGNLEAN